MTHPHVPEKVSEEIAHITEEVTHLPDEMKKRSSLYFLSHKKFRTLLWALLFAVFIVSVFYFGIDKKLAAAVLLAAGLFTHAFSAFLALIVLIPYIGPLLATILSLPFFLLINAVSYIVTMVALKKGMKTEVTNSKVIATAILVGFVLGFVAARVF
ncbi:MAG: hypothetical protein QME66_06540 [Candidatus Eisenbacteria bacterium]|nr:hypothetical protein [Candidatus Eisenbacteria bacterium]